ncbi:helix-turn-helix domain-containing protein [Draconibacterium orientale]|nr:helix-turn-helix domain-containing protein [Draconibacterium orientale]
MDLAVEFKKLQKSQEQILEMLKQSNTEKKELKVYSLDELAAFFGVTKRTLYNWKDEGKLPLIIVGSKSYMTEAQLQTFLSKNEVKPFNNRRF